MINKFLELNKKILNNYLSQNQIAIVDRARPVSVILSALIISAIANGKKMNTIIITDNLYKNIIKIYKSFGFNNFFIVSRFKNYVSNIFCTILSIISTIHGIYKIYFFGFQKFINKFYVNKVHVGDLIYDSYIRNNLNFINPKVDIKLLKIIFFACFKTYKLGIFFKKYKIKYLFVLTDCYATNEAISIRLAKYNNIKVFKIYWTENRIFMIEAKNFMNKLGFLPIHKYFSAKTLSKIIKLKDKQINKFLNNRFIGKINFSYCSSRDLINANKIKLKYSKEEFLKKIKKDKINFDKIILFAPHAFSDAPHHFGTNFLFKDYYEQFTETIKFVENNKIRNILWLVRPHPSSIMYNEENIIKEYINRRNDNIKFCDANIIGTKNLIDICDTVVTGRGTIGLEFACFGKKPIIAGSSTYSKFGITTECKTKKEYFESFSNIKSFKKLDYGKRQLAKKLLYYIETLYPLKLNKLSDNLILNNKKKSIINLLNPNITTKNPVWTNKFFKKLNVKKFDEDEIYKFYYKNAKYF